MAKSKEPPRLNNAYSISWYAEQFQRSRDYVRKQLKDVKPVAIRGNAKLYSIIDAAPRLCDPLEGGEETPPLMDPEMMHPEDRKHFWDAALKEQKFRLQDGDLWETAEIIRIAANAFKIIKTKIMLFSDVVEREKGLNEKQRKIINQQQDDLIEEIRVVLVNELDPDAATHEIHEGN